MTSKSGTSLAVSYVYDTGTGTNLIGRQARMTDAAGTTTYSYDSRGRLISFSRTINGSPSTITTTYDEMDRVLSQVFPNLDTLTYDYGDHGLAVNLNLNGWYVVKGAQYN